MTREGTSRRGEGHLGGHFEGAETTKRLKKQGGRFRNCGKLGKTGIQKESGNPSVLPDGTTKKPLKFDFGAFQENLP